MNALIVTGSPREGMFSDRIGNIVGEITEGKVVNLRKKHIGPCHACEYCHEIKKGECIQRDDMTALYRDIYKAELLAIVSPIYWWQVTAQTKLFIDRLYALKKDVFKGLRVLVILNGDAEDDDVEFQILKNAFSEMCDYLGAKLSYLGIGTHDEDGWKENEAKVRQFVRGALS